MTTDEILAKADAQIVSSRACLVRNFIFLGLDIDHCAPLQRYALDGDDASIKACWAELARIRDLAW